MNCSSSGRGRDGSAQVHAGGGDSVEESVHGSAQCAEHAGGGAVQLGEVQLHGGFLTGLVGGCGGCPEPARKHKTGMKLTVYSVENLTTYLKCISVHRLRTLQNMYLCDGLVVVAIKYMSVLFQAFSLVSGILLRVSTQVSNDLLDLQQATEDIPVVALPWLPQIYIPTKD